METTVYVSSAMDWKSRFHNWWLRLELKSVLQHFGLLITLMAYTVLGGLVMTDFNSFKITLQNK